MQKAYVDGSLAKQGGWAAVIRGERNYEYSGHFDALDSYEAELCAVYKALETAESRVGIVCDHKEIVKTLREVIECGNSFVPPEKCKHLWLKIMYEAPYKLDSVEWVKTDSTPEMRIAHKMANNQAKIERVR
jgi:ribonuclease HI